VRIIATILMREEHDVAAVTLEHLRQQGIDHVVVTDNASVGPVRQVIRDYADAGFVTVIDEPRDNYAQSEWVTRMARMAAADLGAEWILNCDNDEYWTPKSRSLTLRDVIETFGPEIGKVRALRRNYLGRAGATGPWHRRLVWRDELTLSERGTPLAPKLLHRADPDVTVAQGNHDANGPTLGGFADTQPIEVLHVPMRSWAQFRAKIAMGGAAHERSGMPGEVGWHWRADYTRLQAGTLEPIYRRRSSLKLGQIVAGRARGTIRHDVWLRDHVESLVANALIPERLIEALGVSDS
jgi:hypothetical protein